MIYKTYQSGLVLEARVCMGTKVWCISNAKSIKG